MTFEQMLEKVRCEGTYPTRGHAEKVVRAVLAAFGRQFTGDLHVELTARLPHEAAVSFTSEVSAIELFTARDFVEDLAFRTGGTAATTRWDSSTVLRVVAQLAGGELISRILTQLPPGYVLLFGRAELTAT